MKECKLGPCPQADPPIIVDPVVTKKCACRGTLTCYGRDDIITADVDTGADTAIAVGESVIATYVLPAGFILTTTITNTGGQLIFDALQDNGATMRFHNVGTCLLYTSPSPRDKRQSRMPSSA